MPTIAPKASAALERRSRAGLASTVVSLFAVVVIGWLDHATGPDFGFSLLYLLPVSWAAWRVGRAAGLAVAGAASVFWLLVDMVSQQSPLASMWNGFTRLAIFATVAVLLSALRHERARLRRLNELLQERNRDLDAFAGRVAHDLKNALAPMAMIPAMLRRAASGSARILEIADRAERSTRRASAVIDALLAFARGSRALEAEESGALQPAVESVIEELDPLVEQLDASLEVDEIPDVHVRCDPGLLHIVLANLVGNAVKYLDGQKVRRVHLSAHIADPWCRIVVEDTGPGIPRDDFEKIFEPFIRASDSRVPGAGIGLATVHRIVHARGGRITVESEEGRGSRFQVWLPLSPLPESRPPIREPVWSAAGPLI